MAAHRWTFLLAAVGIALSPFLLGRLLESLLGEGMLYVFVPVVGLQIAGLLAMSLYLHGAREYAPTSLVLGLIGAAAWMALTAGILIAQQEAKAHIPLPHRRVQGELGLVFVPIAAVSQALSLLGLRHAELKAKRKLAIAQ
jgi:hypothetical protein